MRLKSGLICLWLGLGAAVSVAGAADLDVDFVRGRVFYKSESKAPFSLKPGKIEVDTGLTLLSFYDGQCFVKTPDKAEFRLKEDSLLLFNTLHDCEVRKGLVGIRADGPTPVKVATPHALVEIADATVIIKTCPVLTRICVIKGSALLKNPRFKQETLLKTGHEVAAGSGMYSKLYAFNDDLRYAWYWVEAEREPSLRPE